MGYNIVYFLSGIVFAIAVIGLIRKFGRKRIQKSDASEQEKKLEALLEEAEDMIQELNRLSDYVVSRLEEKNNQVLSTLSVADVEIDLLSKLLERAREIKKIEQAEQAENTKRADEANKEIDLPENGAGDAAGNKAPAGGNGVAVKEGTAAGGTSGKKGAGATGSSDAAIGRTKGVSEDSEEDSEDAPSASESAAVDSESFGPSAIEPYIPPIQPVSEAVLKYRIFSKSSESGLSSTDRETAAAREKSEERPANDLSGGIYGKSEIFPDDKSEEGVSVGQFSAKAEFHKSKYKEVVKLSESGMSEAEIAKTLGIGRGEVRLLLNIATDKNR